MAASSFDFGETFSNVPPSIAPAAQLHRAVCNFMAPLATFEAPPPPLYESILPSVDSALLLSPAVVAAESLADSSLRYAPLSLALPDRNKIFSDFRMKDYTSGRNAKKRKLLLKRYQGSQIFIFCVSGVGKMSQGATSFLFGPRTPCVGVHCRIRVFIYFGPHPGVGKNSIFRFSGGERRCHARS